MKQTKKLLLLILSLLAAISLILAGCFFFFSYLPEQKERERLEESIRQYYEDKLSLYQKENEGFADYEVDVAFLGDSLTDGYDLNNYYPHIVTANRGIGGETTIGLEKRLPVSVYDLKPKVVVMLIGGNNMGTMFDNYEDILLGLKEHLPETKVVLLSLTAMGREWAHKNQIAAYNNVKIKALAQKYTFTYIDLFSLLLDPQTDEIRTEYTNDGVHLTHEGYLVLTEAITPVLDKLLENS